VKKEKKQSSADKKQEMLLSAETPYKNYKSSLLLKKTNSNNGLLNGNEEIEIQENDSFEKDSNSHTFDENKNDNDFAPAQSVDKIIDQWLYNPLQNVDDSTTDEQLAEQLYNNVKGAQQLSDHHMGLNLNSKIEERMQKKILVAKNNFLKIINSIIKCFKLTMMTFTRSSKRMSKRF